MIIDKERSIGLNKPLTENTGIMQIGLADWEKTEFKLEKAANQTLIFYILKNKKKLLEMNHDELKKSGGSALCLTSRHFCSGNCNIDRVFAQAHIDDIPSDFQFSIGWLMIGY